MGDLLNDTMANRHHLRCLGEPALVAPTGRPVDFRTRKALGLLVFLAVESRTHLREVLAEMFWTRAGSQEARHSLANAISEIRRRLGRTAVETAGDKVRLRADVVELDLERLVAGEVLGDEVRAPLDVDGFLEGFDLPDAVGFAHWKEGQRARLIPAVRDALVVLIDRARRTGDFAGLGRLGERLTRFDELSEDGIRARMESRAFAGDRLGALRLYERWRSDLEGHLGAAPSAMVEGMAMRLRRKGWERPGEAGAPAVRTDAWRGRHFVGRTDEYRQLYESWESARRGEPRHRLLVGDSGVGKSTLVERFAAVAALEGASVVRTQCHDVERELPYVAVSELIKQLIECPGASATPPEHLAELAQHISAVARRFPSLPTTATLSGDASRIRFSDAMHALLESIAEERPVVAIIDDMHHCDDVSLSVLNHVLRQLRRQPVLCIMLARRAELRTSPNAARMVAQADSLGIQSLELPPLKLADASELLDLLLASHDVRVNIGERRALLGASGGYPLALELLVRDWRQNGANAIALQLDAITPAPQPSAATRETYRLVLDRLLGSLDTETRAVVHTAALLGPHLNDPAMYSLADLTASQIMHGLARLTEMRLLRDTGTGIEFANDVIRAEVYLSIPQSMRRLMHERVAEALLARIAKGEAEHHLDLAWHCMRCGRTEQAMAYLLQGARAAAKRGAVHEAEFRLASALDHFTEDQRVDAVLVLCELLQEQSRWKESLHLLETNPSTSGTVLGQLYRLIALTRANQLLTSELREGAELVITLADSTDLDPSVAKAAVFLASTIHGRTLDVETGRRLVAAVCAIETRPWNRDDAAAIMLGRLKLQFGLGMTRSEREGGLGKLEAMARQTNARRVASTQSFAILQGIAVLNATLGRMEEAVRAEDAAVAIAAKLENPELLANAHANRAYQLGWLGEHMSQLRDAERIVRSDLLEHVSPFSLIKAITAYSMAALRLGRPEEVHEAMQLGRERLPALRSATMEQQMLFFEADCLDQLGDVKAALQKSLQAIEAGNGSCLNWRAAASGAARAAARIVRAGGDHGILARDTLRELRQELDTLEVAERAEAISAMLVVEEDPRERIALRKELAGDLQFLPRYAEQRLKFQLETSLNDDGSSSTKETASRRGSSFNRRI